MMRDITFIMVRCHFATQRLSVRSVVFEPRPGLEEIVQRFFPILHESLIMLSREFGDELVPGGANACVAVGNISKTTVALRGELDLQPTSRNSRQDFQHLDKPSS